MQTNYELGYTLTDCYRGNADFNGQQKQYVLKIDNELKHILIDGFVNCPADEGRGQTYHKIADLTQLQIDRLKEIKSQFKTINWNTGKYGIYTNLLSTKKYKALKQAESDYIKTIMAICEPVNVAAKNKAKRAVKAVIKPLLNKTDYKACERYLYIWS